jgi:hypothetical protein
MLTGLEILIARMKDHPEEFLMQRKWDELIEHYGEYFTDEELNAYKAARGEMMRDLFNEAVLKRLAGEEDDGKSRIATYSTAQVRQAFGATDPRAMYGQAVARQEGQLVNNPMLAAKQANAAMQQEAYNAALQQQLYPEQRGMLNSTLGSSYHSPRLFGL